MSRAALQPIVGWKTTRKQKSYSPKGRWSGFYTQEQTVCLLACGCTKTFRGMSGGPKTKTACPNGHPAGFVAESKAVAS